MRHISRQIIFSVPISSILVFLYYYDAATTIYNVANNVCKICSLILLWKIIKRILRKPFKFDSNISYLLKNWLFSALIVCVIIAIFCSPCFYTTINYHNLQLEPVGGRYGYATLAESEYNKTYTLEAEVNIGEDKITDLKYDYNIADYIEVTKSVKEYYISRIYFNNGGYLYFEESLIFDSINDTCTGTDQNGKEWEVTLLNNHIGILTEEHNPLDTLYYITWICSIVFTILLIFLLYKDYKEELNNDFE